MYIIHYSCQILIQLEFPRQIIQKKSVITKFHENPFGESRVVPRGRSEMTELTQLRVDAQKLQYIFRLFFLLLDPNGLEWYVVGTEQVFDIVL